MVSPAHYLCSEGCLVKYNLSMVSPAHYLCSEGCLVKYNLSMVSPASRGGRGLSSGPSRTPPYRSSRIYFSLPVNR